MPPRAVTVHTVPNSFLWRGENYKLSSLVNIALISRFGQKYLLKETEFHVNCQNTDLH